MKWGAASISGAICHIRTEEGQLVPETIGAMPPVGICGTGYIEAIAALLDEHILDVDGLLSDGYFSNGYALAVNEFGEIITITQSDIREFQKAKAAVRAGIAVLVEEAGIEEAQLEKIVVAGGFGTQLDIRAAVRVGLLCRLPSARYASLGNAALKGCQAYIVDGEEQAETQIAWLQNHYTQIELAEHPRFQENYLRQLGF
jgi:uncharacterized 2Fe-2S/4Fe-4S cluster protein (DUF4445 family)